MMQRVITISQQKGGSGKTTIAAHLAVALAQKGYKVSAIDTDPQGSLTAWHEAREKYADKDTVELGFRSFSDWQDLTPEITRLRSENDILVIDTPPHAKDDAAIAITEADLVIVPIQPSPTDLWATASIIKVANQKNTNTFVLLNRVVRNTKLARQFIRDLPRRRIKSTLGNRIAFPYALAEGKAVTETDPYGNASWEIWKFVDEAENILLAIANEEVEAERQAKKLLEAIKS